MSLFQHGMSLDVGGCFQRGMSLNGSGWVDHGSHGDRHERDATVRARAAQGLPGGDGGSSVPVRRGRRGALLAPPGGAQALCLPSAQAGEQRAGAALSGSHHGLFTAAADAPGAAVLGHRRGSPSATVHRHRALRESTRPPMWRFWPRPTPCTTRSRDPPPSI